MGSTVQQGDEMSSSSTSESDYDDEQAVADLGGYTPEVQHRPGIIALLNQTFRDKSINVSAIADLIVEQKLGTAIILRDDEIDDEANVDEDEVFTITAGLNFQSAKMATGVKDLRIFLLKKISEHGNHEDITFAENVFKAEATATCTFLVNEKMINLPPQFTVVPLSFLTEITETVNSDNENGDTIVCILKLYKKLGDDTLCFQQPEQAVFCDFATRYVDYPVDVEDFGSVLVEGESEDATPEDCPAFRRICFVTANVFRNSLLPALNTKVAEFKTQFEQQLHQGLKS